MRHRNDSQWDAMFQARRVGPMPAQAIGLGNIAHKTQKPQRGGPNERDRTISRTVWTAMNGSR
jgi:hypothetical protein